MARERLKRGGLRRAATPRQSPNSARRPTFSTRKFLTFAFLLLPFAFCLSPSARAAGGWTRQRSGTFAWLHAVFFVDGERGWAVGGKGALLRTTDGGRRWEAMQSPSGDALRDVFFVDGQTGWLVCERDIYRLKAKGEGRSYLLKTTDGGASWARVEVAGLDPKVRFARVVFADAAHGWAFGELGTLYATADGGASWARQSVPARHLLLGASFLDARRGWVVGAGATALYTTDGGATWRAGAVEAAASSPSAASSSSPSAGGATTKARLNAVSFVDERRGWAVGAGGAVYATGDGGRVWRALDARTDADLFDVKFLDGAEGWASGAGGTVLHTTDGGATWSAETSPTTHPLERLFFAGRARGWAVGFGGTIISYAPAAPPSTPTADRQPRLRGVR